jgi:hypothetical protein
MCPSPCPDGDVRDIGIDLDDGTSTIRGGEAVPVAVVTTRSGHQHASISESRTRWVVRRVRGAGTAFWWCQ